MGILTKIFDGGTRSIRLFNLLYHLIWFILLLAHITDLVVIDLPDTFEPKITLLTWFILFSIGLSILSLLAQGRRRILAKYVSLLLGSLIQLIIAYKYVSMYPPLTPMVIVSSVLAFWFIIGALYVKRENKETIHGISATT